MFPSAPPVAACASDSLPACGGEPELGWTAGVPPANRKGRPKAALLFGYNGAAMIRLTKHAAESIEKRQLTFGWIERTLAAADFTRPDPRDRTLTRSFKAIAEAGGRILRVVHRREGDDIVIATVHFDRDAKP